MCVGIAIVTSTRVRVYVVNATPVFAWSRFTFINICSTLSTLKTSEACTPVGIHGVRTISISTRIRTAFVYFHIAVETRKTVTTFASVRIQSIDALVAITGIRDTLVNFYVTVQAIIAIKTRASVEIAAFRTFSFDLSQLPFSHTNLYFSEHRYSAQPSAVNRPQADVPGSRGNQLVHVISVPSLHDHDARHASHSAADTMEQVHTSKSRCRPVQHSPSSLSLKKTWTHHPTFCNNCHKSH